MKLQVHFATQGGAKTSAFPFASSNPNKDLFLQYFIINVSQMAEGLASSVLSDAYLTPVYNVLMFS